MTWWRITTSEAALWLLVLFISLKEVPGTESLPGTQDKNHPQSRTRWCQETNACAGCQEAKRPRCLKRGQLLLEADLCGCCFSCVALRDLGESCGSQLSTWPEVSGVGPASSSVKILATTWCRERLACVNSVCVDLSGNIKPTSSSWLRNDGAFFGSKKDDDTSDLFGQDVIPFEAEDAFPTAERYRRTTAPLWEPILVNHDDPNPPRTASSTSVTPMPSMESNKRPQPCYAKREETITVSSYPFDDTLGRIATANFDGQRFQLVYTADLLSELKILLNVVDTFHEDSLPDESSLLDVFSGSLSIPDDDDDDGTPSKSPNLRLPEARKKREVESRDDDAVGFAPPENIQEILIRGASAHQEYVDGSRAGYDQNSDTSDKNASISSQEDESTVRMQITNRPRKVQTLIDFEEDEEDEEDDDEDRRSSSLSNRENAKDTGRMSSFADDQTRALSGTLKQLGPTKTSSQNTATKKTARIRPPIVSKEEKSPAAWTKTLATFDDRLTLVEIRMNFFERVLEEIAKWNNYGVLPMAGDCLVPQTSDMLRYGRRDPEADEHLVLASGIDPVRTRGSRRKANGNVQKRRDGFHDAKMIPGTAEVPGIVAARQMAHRGRSALSKRNFFRTLIENGSPRRPETTGHRGPGRPVKSLCRNPGSSWRESSADVIDDTSTHRTVQRSVPWTNPFSSNSSGLEERGFSDENTPGERLDDQDFPVLEETQIPVPGNSPKDSTILWDLEKPELASREDVFPEEWVPAVEITPSSDTPPWKMFILDEKELENEPERTAFARMEPGNLQRSIGRSKRAVKPVDGIQPPRDTPRKILSGSSTRRTGRLFEKETAANEELGPDANRNMWSEAVNAENAESRRVTGPLILNGNSEFRNQPEPMASRLLFRNSDPLQMTESTAAPTSQDNQKAPYSITNHGNSTIRIEKINETEYDEGLPDVHDSSTFEDDFDHIYESVEAEVFDGDFEYDVAYDQVEYVDGSSVEIVTDEPQRVREPEVGLKSVQELSRGGIHSVIFPHGRNRRASKAEDDLECESGGRGAKRELPLLLFGSSEKHEPKTIVWPSKWTGYRRDRILGSGRSGNQKSTAPNSRSLGTGALPITTTPSSLPTKTTESLTVQHHLGNEEEVTSYVATPKISGVDRRARKNRRKLVWRR